MSIKSLMAMALGAALMVPAMSAFAQDTKADDEKKTGACCMSACAKGASGAKHGSGTMRCSLTGQTVETCCCVHSKEGKLHCNLADKDVESCCCKPVTDETDATDDRDNTDDRDHTGDEAQR